MKRTVSVAVAFAFILGLGIRIATAQPKFGNIFSNPIIAPTMTLTSASQGILSFTGGGAKTIAFAPAGGADFTYNGAGMFTAGGSFTSTGSIYASGDFRATTNNGLYLDTGGTKRIYWDGAAATINTALATSGTITSGGHITVGGSGDLRLGSGSVVYLDYPTGKHYLIDGSTGLELGRPGTATTGAISAVGTVNSSTTGVGNVGASGPDDLQTYQLPANALTTTGRCLRITATGTTANNANAKTVRLVFGAGPTVMISKQLTASIAGSWQLTGTICRTGASAQRYWGTGENSGGTTVSTTDGTGVWRVPTVTNTATETETAAINIKVQSTTSTTDNDIVSQHLIVEYI